MDGDEIKKKLIQNKVFVATYWPNVIDWTENTTIEYVYATNIVPIPIDQRNRINEMEFIGHLIL